MNETMKTLHNLHTAHGNFSSREVSESDLKIILDACVCAASASARQSYSIIVIDDKVVMREYLDYVGSRALLFCVDYTRLNDTAEYLHHPHQCGGMQDFITGSTDTILAAQTAAVAATSLGIDTMFTNSIHRKDWDKLYDKFKLPRKHCFPLITLILGYSTNKHHTTRGRLNGSGVIHYAEYNRLNDKELEEIVMEYDIAEKNMGLEFFKRDASQSYQRYLDWFYCVWSKPRADEVLQRKSDALWSVLRNAGFLSQDPLQPLDSQKNADR